MQFTRILIIFAVHLVVFAGIYVISKVGDGAESGAAMAGANGIVSWSNQDRNANEPTVDASYAPFDERASDVNGYNAGDVVSAGFSYAPEDRPRYAPTRPADYTAPQSQDDSQLEPLPSLPMEQSREKPTAPLPDMIEYKVASGDSLWAIARRFKTTVAAIAAANPNVKANAIRVGQTLEIPRSKPSYLDNSDSDASSVSPEVEVDGTIYVVKAGDSLSRIATSQGTTVQALKAANSISGSVIRIGQKLIIPNAAPQNKLPSMQHKGPKVVVKAGDTLNGIAQRFGVTMKELILLNEIDDPRRIRIGQTILIPERGAAPTPPKPAPVERAPEPVVEREPVRLTPTPPAEPATPEPEAAPEPSSTLQLLEEGDAVLFDEELIEQPVIPIEE